MQWLKKMIAEQLEAVANEKFRAVLVQLGQEVTELNSRLKADLARLPSKADFEWLRHEATELRDSIDNLKNNMRAWESFDLEVERRLAKLESKK